MRYIPLIAPLLLWSVPCRVLLHAGQNRPLPVAVTGTALFALGLITMPLAMVRGRGRRQQDWAAIVGDTVLGGVWGLFTWSVLFGVLLRLALALIGVGDGQDRARIVDHGHYNEAQSWVDLVDELGWEPLRNRHPLPERGGDTLVLAGVDDVTAESSSSAYARPVPRTVQVTDSRWTGPPWCGGIPCATCVACLTGRAVPCKVGVRRFRNSVPYAYRQVLRPESGVQPESQE
ncbi:hypothetical protein [Streptomyces sp. NPDC003863]